MLSEPRTISLLSELIHIPMKHAPERLREVYNRVCQSCGYENFIRTPAGARIERQDVDSGGFSHLNFTGDRIQLTEDHIGISVDQFAQKVSSVVNEAMSILRIPVVLVQQVTIRVISTPNHYDTSGELLGRSIFRFRAEDLETIGRPTSVFGLKLMFPRTRDEPHAFSVRVESYLRDGRSLYIENVGLFKTPVQIQSLDALEKNVQKTSSFIVEKVVPFLSRYDRREID